MLGHRESTWYSCVVKDTDTGRNGEWMPFRLIQSTTAWVMNFGLQLLEIIKSESNINIRHNSIEFISYRDLTFPVC